jgi:transcriptional regulator with XRE-family HTH domain
MKDRIKEVRKNAGMTQGQFGGVIGVAQTTIAGYENGSREIPNSAILSICREFGVNEVWLRTGAGEMYAGKSRAQEMGELVQSLMADSPESFRSALITTLLRFRPDGPEWEVLERIYEGIANQAKSSAPPDNPEK